jgi:hypothetical protein
MRSTSAIADVIFVYTNVSTGKDIQARGVRVGFITGGLDLMDIAWHNYPIRNI